MTSLEAPIFEGHRRGKAVIDEGCAGLLSARRGEILFSEQPPRKAHPTIVDGLAGLGSKQAIDVHRGKGRPMTASSAFNLNRNPILLTDQDAQKTRVVPEGVFKGHLGQGLVEQDGGETARLARRPATARQYDTSCGLPAGAPSQLLHRHESAIDPHGRAHTPNVPSAGIEGVLHYRFAGLNSVAPNSPIESRASERERYEAELRRLHQERVSDAQLREARARGCGAPSTGE